MAEFNNIKMWRTRRQLYELFRGLGSISRFGHKVICLNYYKLKVFIYLSAFKNF